MTGFSAVSHEPKPKNREAFIENHIRISACGARPKHEAKVVLYNKY